MYRAGHPPYSMQQKEATASLSPLCDEYVLVLPADLERTLCRHLGATTSEELAPDSVPHPLDAIKVRVLRPKDRLLTLRRSQHHTVCHG